MPTCKPDIASPTEGSVTNFTIDMLSRRSGQVFNRVNHCQSVHTSNARKLNINVETRHVEHVEQLRETTTADIEPYLSRATHLAPWTRPTEAVATAIAAGIASARVVKFQRKGTAARGFRFLRPRNRCDTQDCSPDHRRRRRRYPCRAQWRRSCCSLRRHGRSMYKLCLVVARTNF